MIFAINYLSFGKGYYSFSPEPEYQLVLDKAVSLGYGLPTNQEMFFQNEMVKALKTSGVWARLDQLYNWYHSAGFGFSSINWIHPNFTLTRNLSLISSFIPKEGARIAGNTGTYFTGTYNPQTEAGHFQLGDASFGWVNGQTSNIDGSNTMVDTSSSGQTRFRQHADSNRGRQYFQQGQGYTSTLMSPAALLNKTNAFYITTRTVSNNKIFQNGTKVRDGSITYLGSAGVTASTNVNYTFNFGTKMSANQLETLRMAFTGGNLTETQCTDFNTIWFNYVNSI